MFEGDDMQRPKRENERQMTDLQEYKLTTEKLHDLLMWSARGIDRPSKQHFGVSIKVDRHGHIEA